MALNYVISVVPDGKQTSEHTVELCELDLPVDSPTTRWAYAGWFKVADTPIVKQDDQLSARADDFENREILKQTVPEVEKSGFSQFQAYISALGLQAVNRSRIAEYIAGKGEADPTIKEVK